MVTIYLFTYNEELMIEFFINHYKKIFPNCIIHLCDNYSTDNTVEIAKKYECIISYYDTNNKYNESKLIELRNNCWKTATTDWVMVVDCDELVQINEEELICEQNIGTTIIKFDGYNMVNLTTDNIELDKLTHGFYDGLYSKKVLFNKSKINDINYNPGCHSAKPNGVVNYNKNQYKLLHYKYISVEYIIDRYKLINGRQSEVNLIKGHGIQYKKSEEEIKTDFINFSKMKLIKLI